MGAGFRRRGGASVVAAAVVIAAAGCAAAPHAGGPPEGTSRSGCAPGLTALAPRTLASGGFTGLALQGADVLATSLSDVQRFPLAGDPASTLTHIDEAYGLVVAADAAYFSASVPVGAPNAQGKQSSSSALFSVALAGGEPTLVLDGYVDMSTAVTDGAAIFFVAPAVGVARVAFADGARTDLPLPVSLLVDALAVQGGTVFVAAQDLGSTSATNGAIVALPVSGGAARTLVANIGHPWSLVADADGLTWVEDPPTGDFSSPTLIVRARLDGAGAHTLLPHAARALAVDGADLYVAWDAISKVPLAGGAEVTLVPGLTAPGLLAVAGGNAAWVDPVSQAKSDPTVPALMTTCW